MRIALFAAAILAMFSLATVAEAKVQTKSIAYTDGDAKLTGYLAWDDSFTGTRPGVLVVHQYLGLTDYEKKRAQMLAQLGYIAFACDIYGADLVPKTNDEGMAAVTKFRSDPTLFRSRLNAGLAVLKSQKHVSATKVAAIGYCFGGGGVLELARSGADIAGVVSFHGLLSSSAPAKPGDIKCKVLVLAGADDPLVPVDQVTAFEDEMRKAGVDWQLTSYGGALHAFTVWGTNMPGTAVYNESADQRSWAAMRDFLNELFVGAKSPIVHVSRSLDGKA